jgi:hypothetical protein
MTRPRARRRRRKESVHGAWMRWTAWPTWAGQPVLNRTEWARACGSRPSGRFIRLWSRPFVRLADHSEAGSLLARARVIMCAIAVVVVGGGG